MEKREQQGHDVLGPDREVTVIPRMPMATDLTMRDHFAGLAMQGMRANPDYMGKALRGNRPTPSGNIADWAYQQADAMLEARNQPTPHNQ